MCMQGDCHMFMRKIAPQAANTYMEVRTLLFVIRIFDLHAAFCPPTGELLMLPTCIEHPSSR